MTNFARWPVWAARLLIAGMAGLIMIAALPIGTLKAGVPVVTGTFSDIDLYRTIVQRMSRGEDYYVAAVAEQRAYNYPTAPAPVIREPTEALLLTLLGNDLVRHLMLYGLAAGVLVALWAALGPLELSPRLRRWTLVAAITGMAVCVAPSAIYTHEVWASLLITLSLALRRPDRWGWSVVAGLAACIFREVALPFLLVMAAFSFYERRWREAAAWVGAIALFCGLFALHCHLADAQHRAGDLTSEGWVRLGGMGFVLATARWNALLAHAPGWMLCAALCVAGLGLAGRGNPFTGRAALTLIGYLAAFAVVGRPNNDYWGILYAPLMPLGIALAGPSLVELASRATGRPWPSSSGPLANQGRSAYADAGLKT